MSIFLSDEDIQKYFATSYKSCINMRWLDYFSKPNILKDWSCPSPASSLVDNADLWAPLAVYIYLKLFCAVAFIIVWLYRPHR